MPFSRQTLPQLVAQITAGFQAMLTGADAVLRRSNLGVSAIVMGAAVDAEYGYLDWIIDNALMPDTAIAPYSTRWGALKGVSPKPPAAATGSAGTTGALPATVVPAGTLLQLQPGIVFQTTAAATVSGGGTVDAPIAAVLPDAGSDGTQWNCAAGTVLSMVQAIAGIPGGWTVDAAIGNGTAPETNAAFVARYLQLFRQPPQGGDAQDYIEWALQLPAVTRAWSVPLWMGPGTVAVYFMEDVAEAAHSGFPQGTNGVASGETRAAAATGDQLALANYLYPLRPATALVYCLAPTGAPINFLMKYVPAGSESAVTAAISGVLTAEGAADGTGTVSIEDIRQAVRSVPGCALSLVLSPNDNITTPVGQLPVIGSTAWS